MTVPKIKDLVKAPSKKYEEMFSLIHQNQSKDKSLSLSDKSLSDKSLQKDELKNFLKSQINNSSSTSINDL